MSKILSFLVLWLLQAKPAWAADVEDFLPQGSRLKGLTVASVLDWILQAIPIFLAPLALLAIIWSGVLYLTSMGDAAKAEAAKKNLTWAVVGLIILIGLWAILKFVVGGLT